MLNAFAAACKADIEKLCPAVMVGEGRILACLEQHKAQVSDQCNKARANADRGLNAQETAV